MGPADATLIFLHLPKTGGTSLRATMRKAIGSGRMLRLKNHDLSPLLSIEPGARAEIAMVEGHMLYGVHEHIARPCVYITMLREPVARLRSWHRYVMATPHHRFHSLVAGERLSLAACIERGLSTELDNHMTRILGAVCRAETPFGAVTRGMFETACRNLERIEFVGTTERMDEFHAMLCERMGWEAMPLAHLNRTTVPEGAERGLGVGGGVAISAGSSGDGETERELRKVREINGFDRALWERAGAILEARLRSARAGA